MTHLLLAQEPVKGAVDLFAARDVVPFQSALILLLVGAVIYLFRLLMAERREFTNFLRGMKEDANGDGKPG